MPERGTAYLYAAAGSMTGFAVLLFLLLACTPPPTEAKTHTLSLAGVAPLEGCADCGKDWALDQQRLIASAARRTSVQLDLPQDTTIAGENGDEPVIRHHRPRKIPSRDDLSPH